VGAVSGVISALHLLFKGPLSGYQNQRNSSKLWVHIIKYFSIPCCSPMVS
jgi:hypothetical protein